MFEQFRNSLLATVAVLAPVTAHAASTSDRNALAAAAADMLQRSKAACDPARSNLTSDTQAFMINSAVDRLNLADMLPYAKYTVVCVDGKITTLPVGGSINFTGTGRSVAQAIAYQSASIFVVDIPDLSQTVVIPRLLKTMVEGKFPVGVALQHLTERNEFGLSTKFVAISDPVVPVGAAALRPAVRVTFQPLSPK